MKRLLSLLIAALITTFSFGQDSFTYSIQLDPISVPNFPGIHSYAFGQSNGKWLFIGGRRDGLHARQPFNAFPEAQNNTDFYVLDIETKQVWSSPITPLPTNIREQLQSTNMNFYQDGDTLYIIGGYAYAASVADFITFPYLTSIHVSGLIDDIINGNPITDNFQQISDNNFAVTGGQLNKLGDTFYLIGGHRFDGAYNPMGNPTYVQTYTEQIRTFKINNTGTLSFSDYATITDAIHLHRRDYNLLPQIFPNGERGFTISSGVFQHNVDLPWLYPVDITENGYIANTSFNQYLSNYHSAKACLFDSVSNEMHNLFFGGMSQYYYQNGLLVQDDKVPFVTTISRLTRYPNGDLVEYQQPEVMPGLKGASAEFIPNLSLPHEGHTIFKLSEINEDTILIGHIVGGILSPTLNPFDANQTNTTIADTTIYSVKLIRNTPSSVYEIDGNNPFTAEIYPNPVMDQVTFEINSNKYATMQYFITDLQGKIVKEGFFNHGKLSSEKYNVKLEQIPPQVLVLTIVIDDKYYLQHKIVKTAKD